MKGKKWMCIVAVVSMIFLIPGCVDTDGELFSGSIIHDGEIRTYVGFKPPRLDENQEYPLMVALHGVGANGTVMMGTALLITKAIREKFIVVAPDALAHPYETYFNAGDHYENLTHYTDDVGFISKLIDEMSASYPVDEDRVYIMGHSNGGIMAYRLAVEIPEKIAAIASNSGPLVFDDYPPTKPVPIIHIHGLEDRIIDYDGCVRNNVTIPPVEEVMETWRLVNNCSATPVQFYNKNDPNSGDIIGRNWTSVDGEHDVVLYTFEKGGHGWRYKDDGLSATDCFWDFLERHTNTS
jgi:polyhydroxybutyrate depolymerase